MNYTFVVAARAVPSLNGRRERIPRLLEWYQTVRWALFDEHKIKKIDTTTKKPRLAPPLIAGPESPAILRAHFELLPRGGKQADLAQYTKALEDAIFGEDYWVIGHYVSINRDAGKDSVAVTVETTQR